MNKLQRSTEKNKFFVLALVSAVLSLFFSLMSVPFVRVLATTRAKLFWLTGSLIYCGLIYYKMNLLGIYIGAVWMTLGIYSQFETWGVNWKKSALLAILTGVLFGALNFVVITKVKIDHELVTQIVNPLMISFKALAPEQTLDVKAILMFWPGIFAATLMTSLAFSLVFETKIFQLFNIKREKLASGLRWLEYKLPDIFMWVTLFSLLLSVVETPIKLIQTLAINIVIVCGVAYFFQGLSILEFAFRIYRIGRFTKLSLYFLIVLWALPIMICIGFADFWLDFRRFMRRGIKLGDH